MTIRHHGLGAAMMVLVLAGGLAGCDNSPATAPASSTPPMMPPGGYQGGASGMAGQMQRGANGPASPGPGSAPAPAPGTNGP